MKTIIPVAFAIIRKLITSLVTTAFCITTFFLMLLNTGVGSSKVMDSMFGSFFVLVVALLIYITIIGSLVSLLSDVVTLKLTSPWRMIIAGVVHVGIPLIYIVLHKESDAKIYGMYVTIAIVFWLVDELLRFLQRIIGKKINKQKENLETE